MRYIQLTILTVCTFVVTASCVISVINPSMGLITFGPLLGSMWIGMLTLPGYTNS